MPGKRRSNGEGSIRKLPSGLWYCQYMDGYKPNGKRNLRHLSAPDPQRTAGQAAGGPEQQRRRTRPIARGF